MAYWLNLSRLLHSSSKSIEFVLLNENFTYISSVHGVNNFVLPYIIPIGIENTQIVTQNAAQLETKQKSEGNCGPKSGAEFGAVHPDPNSLGR
jgi:hypothetical protein